MLAFSETVLLVVTALLHCCQNYTIFDCVLLMHMILTNKC